MKYCMECGSALAKKDIDGTERLACTACSFVHWGNYSIGVGALVVRDDKVLLVRRAIEPGKGKWTNPGGYIEQLEPIEDTIVREVYEESGIRAKVQEIIAVRDLPTNVHNVYIAFRMDYVEGEPVPDGVEADAAGFFSLEEMRMMPVATFTEWLVDIAMTPRKEGLFADKQPVASFGGFGYAVGKVGASCR
ncbi:NUDIX hydrolase [Paenibacillus sp. EPM92]|uniref:NUDIX hydrolase n=1 Tax=Paenibacillus sp. EPM92 TaxID=1561195 RepID=UPI000A8A77C1|nr:NUDIX hydrolase [Paenibacillus sp. EPM92]